MKEDTRPPQINIAKIGVGGNIAGVIFAVSSMAIFLIGLPVLWYIFPAAIVLGGAVALTLRFVRHDTPSTSRILFATKK